MIYDALDVAKYVINYEASQNRSVSNLRLQKLLYFIQAQFLVTNHHACFPDKMEAWDLGQLYLMYIMNIKSLKVQIIGYEH